MVLQNDRSVTSINQGDHFAYIFAVLMTVMLTNETQYYHSDWSLQNVAMSSVEDAS
jgi:hypothetical protein